MNELWLQQLHAWHDFYVLAGTAAATLTGLMFIVISLNPRQFATNRHTGVRAFVTPTVVYFTSVLVIGALMTVPSLSARVLAALLAGGALGAVVYLVSRGGHRLWRESKLDRADWAWYVGLPILSYAVLLVAAVLTWIRLDEVGLEVAGGTVIALLVVAIRNAWDLVLWVGQNPKPQSE
jgi:hypothetical protein